MAGPWEKYGGQSGGTTTRTVPAARMREIIADVQAGRPTKPRKPTPTPTPAPAPSGPWQRYGGNRPAETDQQRQIRKFSTGTAEQARAGIAAAEASFAASLDRRGITGRARDAAMTRFRTDPRMNALRKRAGMPEFYTRRDEVRETARRVVREQQNGGTTGFTTALKAGITRGLFGIPERIAAAGLYYTGQGGNSYNETLDFVRDKTDAELEQSTGGNVIGQIMGGFSGGGVVGNTIKRVAVRGAASASPLVARAGNFLENLITLKKGQRVANAGRVALSGAGYGTAQAVGEGSDPVAGAGYGAAGGTLLHGGLKAAQVLTRPVRDVLRMTRADAVLSRLTGSNADEIAARAARYREATGAEPTVFELLPLADRNKLLKQGIVGRDAVVEQASTAIRRRAENLGPEMSARAQEIVGPQRQFIERGIEGDLTRARGGAPDPADPALVTRAARSPTDMLELRGEEGRAIMAPFENTRVVDSLDELFPSVPAPTGNARIATDPEVSTVIRSAAGVMRQRADNAGITAGDITDMISTLRGDLAKGGIEARTAQRAIQHLQDVLDTNAPDAGAAAREMSDVWASRSRMAEGMQEGARTRLRDDVQVGTSRREAQRVRNAYDTPEGAAGRALGQSNRVLSDLAGSPDEALRATVGMSRGSVGRQLEQNLGGDPARRLIDAARAQDESAQALAAASAKATSGGGAGNLDGEGLVQALVGLHPSSFITTKASAIRTLMDMTYIPESRARVMVDMLFSQNPDLVRRALTAIGNSPNGAAFTQRLAGVTGQMLAGVDEDRAAGSASPDDADLSVNEPEIPVDDGLTVDVVGGRLPLPGEEGYDEFIAAGYETNPDGTLIDAEAAPVDDDPGGWADPGGYDVDGGIDVSGLPYAHAIVAQLFPGIVVTEDERDPNSRLGRANPGSYHNKTQNAVDVRPIPGMTFDQFIGRIRAAGFDIIESRDEVKNPTRQATGPHWHVVIAGKPA